jgi:two-component system cell cycle sensor histidine kinase/response regulator CckA
MTDEGKTREQLLEELATLQRRVVELEANEAQLVSEVAQRKRAEEALRESECNLGQAQAMARLGHWRLDPKTEEVSASHELLRIFGLDPDDANLASFVEVVHPDDREHDLFHIERGMESGESWDIEHRLLLKDGTEKTVHAVGTPTLDQSGKVKLLLGTVQDITERKQAEDERLKLEAQVLQAQKMESLGILAGGIAHDFNNILTPLLGNADLVVSNLPSHSPIRPLLHDIQKAGRRAADLTRQMLAYSGQGNFVIEDIDINALVQDMSSLLESSTSKKVGLSYELSADLPAVRADATQLRQIVLNLVSNGSEAVGDKGGVVRVSTDTTQCDRAFLDAASPGGELAEGRYVTIEVTDTGCGMDEETKAKVFDPFFTTKFTGRGLGLAAVEGIVRGHKGAILVESELGKGTTFKVLLPALEHPATRVEARTKEETGWRGTGTILVVDDEEMVRTVAVRILKRLGFSVLMASDGVEAINIFRERHDEIACVLLDLKMPNMDGKETFDELCRINADVPVILCSGYSEQDSTEQFGDRGLAGFIAKPYNKTNVRDKLREVLGD